MRSYASGAVVIPVNSEGENCASSNRHNSIHVSTDEDRERDVDSTNPSAVILAPRTDSERSLTDTIQQNELLSDDVEQWMAMESRLLQANSVDALKLAVADMHKVFQENPLLCENIGLEPVISAGRVKREASSELWTAEVAKLFGSLLRIIKDHYQPNGEVLSPDEGDVIVGVKDGDHTTTTISDRLSRSTSIITSIKTACAHGVCSRWPIYIVAFLSSLILFLGLQAVVLFAGEYIFPAFPYVIAAILAVTAILGVPFVSHRIVRAGIHITELSNVTLKIVTLKLFRNSTYVLIFFCFAGAPTTGNVTSYNITVAVMSLILYFVVCYIFYYRICEVLDAQLNEDRILESDYFTEETGFQISRDDVAQGT